MTKTWTFNGTEDIVHNLRCVANEIEGGSLRFDNTEIHHVMTVIEQFLIDEAEATDDND